MHTNFFTQISNLIDGVDYNLTIKKIDGKLTVVSSTIPRIDDEAKNKIAPLKLVATPEELDENFFDQVKSPLQKITIWAAEMKEFEKGVAQAEADRQITKQKQSVKIKEDPLTVVLVITSLIILIYNLINFLILK